jgi:hypothetical protein
MTRIFQIVVFLVGLAVAGWIGAGYIGLNPLALGVTVLIGVFYVVGARELQNYGQATSTLSRAIAGLTDAPVSLAGWLDQLHPTLRNPVRLRVEGERAALPGPTLTPYLVGLLVLLGMLGTFLGMVATLRGTGIALESATDLHAIRASLAAPVKGLGFAFGTSVAGVATSAMLGLLSALCRRERIQAARQLDVHIGSTLRGYSRSHQRDESFKLLQKQAEVMPVLADRLQAMMTVMEQRNQALNDQLASGISAMERHQQALNERMTAGHENLGARLLAGQTSLGEELRAGQASLSEQLLAAQESLSQRFMAGQEALGQRLAGGQEAFHVKAEAAYGRLASSVDASLKESVAESTRAAGAALQPVVQATMASLARETAAWREALAQTVRQQHEAITQSVQRQHESVTGAVQRQLDSLSSGFETTAASVAETWNTALAGHQRASDALAQDLRASLDRYAETVEQRSAGLLDAMSARLDTAADRMSQAWTDALSLHEQTSGKLAEDNRLALAGATDAFARHSSSLLAKLDEHSASLLQRVEQQSSSALQGVERQLVERDRQRLDAWTEALGAIAADLRKEWQQAGEHSAGRQQEICDTLARTAREITSQAQAHAGATIAEIERLVQAASEAPKAAADVVAELRQKLSDSMVRDNAMLEERARLLDTLGTLLDAVNRASTEQRQAVDALVSTSADLLDRVGNQFTGKLESETGKLSEAAGQVTGSVVEVASLGEAFGAAVQSFGESNGKLMAHLERIEAALEKSIARSDEQLAYYVAQAREVVDLSLMSQKQILEDLQQLAAQQASVGTEAE